MEWIAIGAALLTGFGTTTLALFTWRLAGSTKADVEAQWRPLLVPCELKRPEQGIPTTIGWAHMSDLRDFEFAFKNVGKGAALYVRGYVVQRTLGNEQRLFGACEALRAPVVAVDDHTAFQYHDRGVRLRRYDRLHVVVVYTDLAENQHRTEATYQLSKEGVWLVESVKPRPVRYYTGDDEDAVRPRGRRLTAPFRAVKSWWLRNPIDNSL